MYLYYVDESGSPYSYSQTSEFYVLSSLILDDSNWNTIDEAVSDVKRKYFPSADLSQIEIRGSKLWNKVGDYSGFSDDQVRNAFSDLTNIIRDNDVKIISIVIKKDKFLFDWEDKDMLTEAWRVLLERIEMFLTGEGNYNHGLIVMDSITPVEDKKRNKLMDSFKIFGTGRVNLNHILEITFTDSGLKNLIQLTDIIAYVTRQHMRADMKDTFSDFWNSIELKLRRDKSGKYVGVGLKTIP